MLHAFDFFSTLHDPFARQKLAGLSAAAAAAEVYGQQVVSLLELAEKEKAANPKLSLSVFKAHIRSAVFASLEGNAGDLSLWPKALSKETTQQGKTEKALQQPAAFPEGGPSWLLAGEFEAFFSDYCSSNSSNTGCCCCSSSSSSNSCCNKCSRVVHLWTDNAGEELLSDLLLCSCLLITTAAHRVRLCVKQQPTYVSDATKVDVEVTLRWLERRGKEVINP